MGDKFYIYDFGHIDIWHEEDANQQNMHHMNSAHNYGILKTKKSCKSFSRIFLRFSDFTMPATMNESNKLQQVFYAFGFFSSFFVVVVVELIKKDGHIVRARS